MRSSNPIAVVVVSAGLVVGCAAKDKSAGATSKEPAPPVARTAFDTPQEPGINAETRFAAGQLAESRNDPANAMKQYEEAVRMKPDHVRALYRLGVVQAELKLYPKAIETWKRYVKVRNDSADGYANLGFCYELAGDVKAAEGAYLKGIAKDAKNQPCRVNYGLMLARQDRLTDAVTNLRAVLTPAQVAYNIGSVHELRGKKAQARVEYQKAIELDPDFSDARQRLAALE